MLVLSRCAAVTGLALSAATAAWLVAFPAETPEARKGAADFMFASFVVGATGALSSEVQTTAKRSQ